MGVRIGIGNLKIGSGGGTSWGSYCTPQNVVITPITGGNRITFTQTNCPLNHTQIWASIDGAAYELLTTLLPGIETYDHIIAGPVIVDYKLRAQLITLGIPQSLASEIITGTGVRLTWLDNSDGDTTHIEVWVNKAYAGYTLVQTVLAGVQTYDYGVDNAHVDIKVRAKLASPVAYSDYSNVTSQDVPSFFDSDALNLFARMIALGETPTGARQTIINDAFVLGKTKAFWAKMLGIYLPAAHATGSANLNWLSSNFNITLVGAPTFTADRGYSNTNGLNYLKTGFNFSTGGGSIYTLNSASIGVINLNETNGSSAFIGKTSGTNTYIQKYTDNNIYSQLNGSLYVTVTTPGNTAKKLLITTRNDATNIDVYVDSTKTRQAKASSALPNVELVIGYQCDGQYAFAFMGAGLTDTDRADIKAVFLTGYLTSIGAI